jgi:ribosomal protein L40E
MNRFHIGIRKRDSLPKSPPFFFVSDCPDLHYNGVSLDDLSPSDTMPANRPNLTLDEQSFQGLLSAAFIIQEHNDRRKLARQTPARQTPAEPEADRVCQHCGAPMPADASRCESCGLDEFRPGERMQRNWASMWLMSQEQGLWPERSPEIREATRKSVPPLEAERRPLAQVLDDRVLDKPALDKAALNKAAAESAWPREATGDLAQEDSDPTVQTVQLSASDDSFLADASGAGTSSMIQRFWDLRVKLRFQRADLYLGAAVFVAALALLWPAAGAPRRAALGPWERALVTLGIAEAPAPVVHLQGDPGIEVWVDPHTALYYCPGEEPYGKTAGGRLSRQRDAQMDRFEPAGRSACE